MDSEASRMTGLHILVVEDEYILAAALIEDLEDMGAIPHGPAPDIEQALKLIIDTLRIDVAILNVRLRGKMSFPVADELLRRDIPFVFVTGNAEQVSHYSVPIHTKPANMAAVAESLRSLVKTKTHDEVVMVLP